MIYKIENFIRNILKRFLDVSSLEYRVDILETLLLHEEARLNGFAVLKRHLNRPDIALPKYKGKDIEQD